MLEVFRARNLLVNQQICALGSLSSIFTRKPKCFVLFASLSPSKTFNFQVVEVELFDLAIIKFNPFHFGSWLTSNYVNEKKKKSKYDIMIVKNGIY
jgi:hypothetical protein